MSLDVAIQSVVFYVLSCSTCSKISHRRKAKVQARKDRLEKQELETQQPGLYRHPSPFSTNPYWHEEIMMGPGPVKKNGDRNCSKNASQQALHTGEQGSSYAGSTVVSDTPSSPTAVTEGSRISGDGWNRTRYQREDEALWGLDFHGPGQKIKDAIAKAGSSASRLLESRLGKSGDGIEEESPGPYYVAKNPPVNDLHPPVVSTQPTSRDETRWMLQPPPSAKIMEGKERVNRSRAGSNTSSRRGGDEVSLGRQLTGKLVDAKLQRGETPYSEGRSTPTRQIKTPTSTKPRAQQHDRQRSSSTDSSSSSSEERVWRKKRRPRPRSISTSARSSIDSIGHPISSKNPSYTYPRSARTERSDRSQRPALGTISSSSQVIPQLDGDKEPSPTDTALKSPPLHTRQLSANVNAMPASIPSVESKLPGADTSRFPRRTSSIENDVPPASV